MAAAAAAVVAFPDLASPAVEDLVAEDPVPEDSQGEDPVPEDTLADDPVPEGLLPEVLGRGNAREPATGRRKEATSAPIPRAKEPTGRGNEAISVRIPRAKERID